MPGSFGDALDISLHGIAKRAVASELTEAAARGHLLNPRQ
jgi:hypothetical protein